MESKRDLRLIFVKNKGRYIVGMGCGYVKLLVKKKAFWVETFSIYQKMGLHLLSSNLLA